MLRILTASFVAHFLKAFKSYPLVLFSSYTQILHQIKSLINYITHASFIKMAFVVLARSSGGSLLKIKISAILQKARIKIVAHAIYLYLFFLINIKSKGLFFNVLMSLLISLPKISLKFMKSLTRYEFLPPRF